MHTVASEMVGFNPRNGKWPQDRGGSIEQIKKTNHSIGNHTYSHLNGWETSTNTYLKDVYKAQKVIKSSLFRPPFGKIKISQIKNLIKDFKIIMWSIMPLDFSNKISDSEFKDNILKNVKKGSIIGPYARIRGETIIGMKSKVGNFVEIKKSNISNQVKINHLSYVGDTEIGSSTNIGAGTITCNYDGKNKNKTKIGKNSFVGSNSTIIAPIKIGDNVTMGAGSVFNRDIPNNNLSIGRAYQINKKNRKN